MSITADCTVFLLQMIALEPSVSTAGMTPRYACASVTRPGMADHAVCMCNTNNTRRKEIIYLTKHSTHFYMALKIW